MKVVVAHNRYRSITPSGENDVVDSEIESLRSAGVEVVPYLRSSDEIDSMGPLARAGVAVGPLVAPRALGELRRLLEDHRPDVVHLHNAFPLISPAAVHTAHRAGVPVVHTVHNHRHVCVKGTHFRDGHLCTECVGKTVPLPALRHGCYQDSRVRSVPMVASQVLHRPTWRSVDRFLALTAQLRDHLVSAGLPEERITVRPNTVDDPGPSGPPGSGFLYVGRLSEEKGVELLLDGWCMAPDGSRGSLTVIGSGPLESLVHERASSRTDLVVRGSQPHREVAQAMRDCAWVVVPSTCPEAFPRVVAESLSLGRPVVATALGGLPGIITPETGLLVDPNPGSLSDGLARAAGLDPAGWSVAARERYLAAYAPDVVLAQLLEVYAEVASAAVVARRRGSYA